MSWLVRILERYCVAGNNQDEISKLRTRNFVGIFFEPSDISIVLYTAVCDFPVRDSYEVVRQMNFWSVARSCSMPCTAGVLVSTQSRFLAAEAFRDRGDLHSVGTVLFFTLQRKDP
jgi:hypothetical protein